MPTASGMTAMPSKRPDLRVQLPPLVKLVTAPVVTAIITPVVPRVKSGAGRLGRNGLGPIGNRWVEKAPPGVTRPHVGRTACRAASRAARSDG